MKNYYEILNVERTDDKKTILKSYRKCVDLLLKGKITEEQFKEMQEAYEILGNDESREQYNTEFDAEIERELEEQVVIPPTRVASEEPKPIVEIPSVVFDDEEFAEQSEEQPVESTTDQVEQSETVRNLEVNQGWFKRNKNKIIVTGLIIASFLCGCAIGKKDTKDVEVNKPSVESPVDTETPQETEEEKIEVLTAENFEKTVDSIVKSNEEKGLSIDPAMVRSALFITNMDNLSQEDIKTLYGDKDLNMIEEIQNMYNYTSAVKTHNGQIRNWQIEKFEFDGERVVEPTEGKFISLANLSHDVEDRAILKELETEYIDLVADLEKGEITEAEFQASFKYISQFFTGVGHVDTKGNSYTINSMTSGAGLLSEDYWSMFAVTYSETEEFCTKENQIDIKTMVDVVDGSRFLGAIINHESLNCLSETEKTK